jgi:hypothetical protein
VTVRLARIQAFLALLTATAVAVSLASGHGRPLGVALGGGAALLDFVLIRRLAASAMARGTSVARVMPLALAKSLLLLAIPASALLLPATLVDGLSFAIGVSALPAAVVGDALLPLPMGRSDGGTV